MLYITKDFRPQIALDRTLVMYDINKENFFGARGLPQQGTSTLLNLMILPYFPPEGENSPWVCQTE